MSTRTVERASLPVGAEYVKRSPQGYSTIWTIVLVVTDLLLFIAATTIGTLVGFHHWKSPLVVHRLFTAEIIFVCLWLFVFWRLGLYQRTYALTAKDELYYTMAALCLGTLPQAVLFTLYPGISTSRIALSVALALSIALVGTSRTVLHHIRESGRFRAGKRRIAVVGTSERLAMAAESMAWREDDEHLFLTVDDVDQSMQINLTQDADLSRIDWFAQARAWGCDTLVLTEMVPPDLLPHMLEVTARHQIQFALAPPRIKCHAYSLTLQTNGQQALIVPQRLRACTPRAQLFKRWMDIALSTIAILIFMPAMMAAAIAVYFESRGPVFYLQERVGLRGSIFRIFKFRSMRLDAEQQSGAVWASEDDPRRTRVGAVLRRFSIDELPQLFNVLRGEMSLVGPRPERPVFVDLFRRTLPRYEERHLVRPGVTGWSQVHMKRVLNTSDAGEKLEYDLRYIENWSPFLDVSVLVQTLFEFLFQRAG